MTDAGGSKLTAIVSAASVLDQQGFVKLVLESTGTARNIVAQQQTAQRNTVQQMMPQYASERIAHLPTWLKYTFQQQT